MAQSDYTGRIQGEAFFCQTEREHRFERLRRQIQRWSFRRKWFRINENGGKGIRTPDLLIANETLYQLSYTPTIETR
jgi:hypothetical protein